MASKRRYVPKTKDCCPDGPLRGLDRAVLTFEGGFQYTIFYSPEGQLWWAFHGKYHVAACETFESACTRAQEDWVHAMQVRAQRAADAAWRKRGRKRKRRSGK